MRITTTISKLFNGAYNYISGPRDVGVGVENMAFVQPGLAVSMNFYAPRYNVRGDLMPLSGAYMLTNQSVPNVDLRADGVYLSGTIELGKLVDNAAQYSDQNPKGLN